MVPYKGNNPLGHKGPVREGSKVAHHTEGHHARTYETLRAEVGCYHLLGQGMLSEVGVHDDPDDARGRRTGVREGHEVAVTEHHTRIQSEGTPSAAGLDHYGQVLQVGLMER